MQRFLLSTLLLTFLFSGCSKDKDDRTGTGTVVEAFGCYNDSWVVLVDNPDPGRQTWLCEPFVTGGLPFYNCANSVILRLPPHLAITGKRIRFTVVEVEPSCLSSSQAIHHLKVVNLKER